MAAMRALLISALIILAAFVGFSYWSGTAFSHFPRDGQPHAVATSGIVDNAALSSKIKAKMVDEHDRALTLARDTAGVLQVIDELRVELR